MQGQINHDAPTQFRQEWHDIALQRAAGANTMDEQPGGTRPDIEIASKTKACRHRMPVRAQRVHRHADLLVARTGPVGDRPSRIFCSTMQLLAHASK